MQYQLEVDSSLRESRMHRQNGEFRATLILMTFCPTSTLSGQTFLLRFRCKYVYVAIPCSRLEKKCQKRLVIHFQEQKCNSMSVWSWEAIFHRNGSIHKSRRQKSK